VVPGREASGLAQLAVVDLRRHHVVTVGVSTGTQEGTRRS
jgi:hypothetical protein